MAETRKLEGKVALVTGAAQGLGEAILKEFALEGAKTIIFDIHSGFFFKFGYSFSRYN